MLQVTTQYQQHTKSVASVGQGRRRGSGFVVAPDRIAILRRSLGGDSGPRVRLGGAEHRGVVVAEDPATGLALVQAPTAGAHALRFAEASSEPGQEIIALGDPGSGLRATVGRISAAPLTIRSATGRSVEALEHTAPLPRGTGGGPLLDEQGSLLGVNVVRADPGFIIAIAGSAVRQSIERMLSGAPQPPRLGVAIAPPAVARRLRRAVGLPEHDGLLVRDVEADSPAGTAGVRVGDLLVTLDGAALVQVDDIHDALAAAGAQATLGVVRGVGELTLDLSLSHRTGSAS